MKRRTFLSVVMFVFVVLAGTAQATIFDTNNTVSATNENYWPWGDADNTRYQLWLSDSMLDGYTGIIGSIEHFPGQADRSNLGEASYNVDIYASTTSVAYSSLSTTDLNNNDGANKTLIYSGNLALPSAGNLVINTDVNNFNYDGNGNLLLDYVFNSYDGIQHSYDGPTWQSVNENSDLVRVTSHQIEGSKVLNWGAIRTRINFDDAPNAVPEPTSLILFGTGLVGLVRLRRTA